MRSITKYTLAFMLGTVLAAGAATAADVGTRQEAEALVKKTVAAIKADGAEKTYAAITAKDPKFIDRDLYPIVYDLEGLCLAHGANAKLVGKDLSGTMDTDGKAYGKERSEKAKTMDSFWVEYKYKNPVTNKIEPKEAYCEKVEKTVVCAGAYKQ